MINPSKKITPLVREILRDHLEAREDYKILIKLVWQKQGLSLSDLQIEELLNNCSTPESITRSARAVWQKKEYLPTQRTLKKRGRMEVNYHNTYSPKKNFVEVLDTNGRVTGYREELSYEMV